MLKQYPCLTNAEDKIMNIIWTFDRPITSVEIRTKSVKIGINGYLYKVLNHLLEKQMIQVVGETRSKKTPMRIFKATCSKIDYHSSVLTAKWSLYEMLTYLYETSDNRQTFIAELRKWLEEWDQAEK